MKWINVKERLPEIPKGKYGISVIVAQFDPCYEECCPGKGYDVYEMGFGIIRYEKMPMFKGSRYPDGSSAFLGDYSLGSEHSYGPVHDRITHWMYLPAPPTEIPDSEDKEKETYNEC